MVKIQHLVVKQWESQLQQLIKVFCQEFSSADSHTQERGSVVVLVALTLTALLGFCAIVADVGLLYAQKVHLQNSVDAAALAGVRELPSNPGKAIDIAIAFASKNGVVPGDVQVMFDPNNDSKIIVTASKKVPTHFARFFGITEEQISISVSSRAMMVPPEGLFGAVPLSIQEQDFKCGPEFKYVLKYGARPDTDLYLDDNKNNKVKEIDESGTSGWYGALELTGPGARTYEEDLAYGYQGTLRVGQIFSVKHGNMSMPTSDAITTRISRDESIPKNTIENYESDAPQIVYIPIVKIIPENGEAIQEVQIIGFAAFFLNGVNDDKSEVTGWFIKTLGSNQISASLPDLSNREQDMLNGETSIDFRLYTSKLVAN